LIIFRILKTILKIFAQPMLPGSGPPPRKPVMALRDLMQDLQQDREDR
jgi:hypothetical protein